MTFSFSNLTPLFTTWQHRHKSTMMCAILTRMLSDDVPTPMTTQILILYDYDYDYDANYMTQQDWPIQYKTRHDKKQYNAIQYKRFENNTIQYNTIHLTFQSFSRQDKTTKQNKIRANYHAAETWQQAFVPERSKGAVSRTAIERCVGSNPTGCILLFPMPDRLTDGHTSLTSCFTRATCRDT